MRFANAYYSAMGALAQVKQKARLLLYRLLGYKNVSWDCTIESNVLLDKVYRAGVIIEPGALVAAGSTILTHEHVKRDPKDPRLPYIADTKIGENTFVGINAIICPGVEVGPGCVIAAGSVVTKDVPAYSLVAGVPAVVRKSDLPMGKNAMYDMSLLGTGDE